jgi:BirA family transcriptional regulator, biotin operon repressor / biotin---[acetyl-CoA-carboxylase] ligase
MSGHHWRYLQDCWGLAGSRQAHAEVYVFWSRSGNFAAHFRRRRTHLCYYLCTARQLYLYQGITMPNTALLPLLANGEFHSGQALADALGVSRTAVWKQLGKLEVLGLEIESVKGRGYRIPGGVDLLEANSVHGGLDDATKALVRELEIFDVIDSTNREALRRVQPGAASGLVFTAEQQTAGRGRRGRQWVSPFARNLYLSAVWEFSRGASALEGLSLAVGVAISRALEASGLPQVQLKWPNDLLYQEQKLGGVLLEMVGDANGLCQVVVGVGLNVAMPANTAASIDQPWTDLSSIAGGKECAGRNELLAALLNELMPLLADFENSGFGPWREPWQQLDAHAGKAVVLTSGDVQTAGIARGVDQRGALLLESSLGLKPIYGGEISLRAAQ